MNLATNLSVFDVEAQPKNAKCIPLFPTWHGYEERKRELQQMNLSPFEYVQAIRELAEELYL